MGQGTTWLVQLGQRKGHELDNMVSVGGYGKNRDKPDPANYEQHDIRLKLQHVWDSVNKLTLSGESFRHRLHTDAYSQQGQEAPDDYNYFEIGAYEHQDDIASDRVALGYNYQSTRARDALNSGEAKVRSEKRRG